MSGCIQAIQMRLRSTNGPIQVYICPDSVQEEDRKPSGMTEETAAVPTYAPISVELPSCSYSG